MQNSCRIMAEFSVAEFLQNLAMQNFAKFSFAEFSDALDFKDRVSEKIACALQPHANPGQWCTDCRFQNTHALARIFPWTQKA